MNTCVQWRKECKQDLKRKMENHNGNERVKTIKKEINWSNIIPNINYYMVNKPTI